MMPEFNLKQIPVYQNGQEFQVQKQTLAVNKEGDVTVPNNESDKYTFIKLNCHTPGRESWRIEPTMAFTIEAAKLLVRRLQLAIEATDENCTFDSLNDYLSESEANTNEGEK